jgi:hypothetical protein
LQWKQKKAPLLGRATSSVPSTETGVISRLI